jgi:hypothetical protein
MVAYLVVGDNKDATDPTMMPSSQSSNHETGSKPSRYKIMTVKRGFSQEGDGILDYLVNFPVQSDSLRD